jgi:hypothetical protein
MTRFKRFYAGRFGSSFETTWRTARAMLLPGTDVIINAGRAFLIQWTAGEFVRPPHLIPDADLRLLLKGLPRDWNSWLLLRRLGIRPDFVGPEPAQGPRCSSKLFREPFCPITCLRHEGLYSSQIGAIKNVASNHRCSEQVTNQAHLQLLRKRSARS